MILNQKTAEALNPLWEAADSRRPLHAVLGAFLSNHFSSLFISNYHFCGVNLSWIGDKDHSIIFYFHILIYF
jgi:hypothetical protein